MKLSLHRSTHTPDWLKVPGARRNRWQRIAKQTNGIVTPANVITLIGFAVALIGIAALLTSHYWEAIILLGVGRLLDIADGIVADRTGTKSGVGELLDATVDKIITVVTVGALVIAHAAPDWLLALFILPHVLISVIVIIARIRSIHLHPSRLGKTTMLLAWIAVSFILFVNALGLHWPNPLVAAVYGFTLVSAGFGFVTVYSYVPES